MTPSLYERSKHMTDELLYNFDSDLYCELNKILQEKENTKLDRLPWIGKDYAQSELKILILGDSHYAIKENGNFCKETYNWFVNEKKSTIEIVRRFLAGENKWRFFRGVHTLFNLSTEGDKKNFWKKIVYYNFVQEIMRTTKDKPKSNNYKDATTCLLNVLEIIKPDLVIFIGIRGVDKAVKYSEKYTYDPDKRDPDKKINNTYPRVGKIETDNNRTNFIAIKHTAQYFSPKEWNKYLHEQVPTAMAILDGSTSHN